MAVFLINICKWNGCGITFPNLGDLIQHIEDTHIDYDPKVVEQKEQAQPACLPLSYVLRFISEDARKENSFIASPTNGTELKRKLAIKHHSYSISSSNRSNTPTGSEMDEDEMVVTESEDSNDSWTTEEFSSEFIMRYGSRHSGTGSNGTPGNEKPFACPVPGCKKRYKNVNGIKYHSKNGHKKDGKVRKGYKCHCGKSYKTAQGLKNHALASHNTATESTLTTQHIVANSGGILLPRSTSPSQSLGSLSPSSISNMSSSASSSHGGNSTVHNNANSNAAILQHLTNGVSATITSTNVNGGNPATATGISNSNNMNLQIQQQQQFNVTSSQQLMQHPHQHQQHQHQQATVPLSGNNHNSNNSFVRSTIGLVSIKANNVNGGNATTAAATNLLAANAAASKILKLAAANAANNSIEIQHQQHQMKATALIATPATPSKITLPNLVNLGILTPTASPTKPLTQGITFSHQQQQSQSQQQAQLQRNALAATTAAAAANQLQREITISGGGGGSGTSCSNLAKIINNNNNNKNNSIISETTTNVVVVENLQTQTQAQIQNQTQPSQPPPPPPPSQTPSQSNEHISLPMIPISSNGNNAASAIINASKSKNVVVTTAVTSSSSSSSPGTTTNQSIQQIPVTTSVTIQHKSTTTKLMESSNNSENFSSLSAASSMQPVNNTTFMPLTRFSTADYSKTVPSAQTATSQSLNISTTFIEHKYSAKKCKEKFYANLRNDNNNNNIKNSKSKINGGKQKQKQKTLPKNLIMTGEISSNTGTEIQGVNVDDSTCLKVPKTLYSPIQELNENFKNIFT